MMKTSFFLLILSLSINSSANDCLKYSKEVKMFNALAKANTKEYQAASLIFEIPTLESIDRCFEYSVLLAALENANSIYTFNDMSMVYRQYSESYYWDADTLSMLQAAFITFVQHNKEEFIEWHTSLSQLQQTKVVKMLIDGPHPEQNPLAREINKYCPSVFCENVKTFVDTRKHNH